MSHNYQDEDLQRLLEQTADEKQQRPTDSIPDKSVNDVDIPDDELTEVVMSDLKNDISDKEDMGWNKKREYDLRAYYGIKDEFLMNYPYPGASAYPVPITPVQVDTGHSMIDDLIWRNPQKVVTVSPVSDEDAKKSKNLEWLLNWQLLNDIPDIKIEDSASNFFMLLHGTSYEKILRTDAQTNQIRVYNTPIEHIYLPIDAKGPDIDQTDHVIQIIPLGANDLRQRIASGVYRNLDKVGKGFLPGSTSHEMLEQMKKQITGLDTTQKVTRDTWYIGEYYKTYYPKGSLRPVELIVHFSPSTGAILRKIVNRENMRPFVDKYIYPNHGKAFHMSLPEKIRNIQEKANYTDKQVTDAADKAISPAGFYDGTEKFDPRINLRAPTSMYPMKNVQSIQWEPINVAPILAQRQEIKNLWLEAERSTGFTDLNQGISTSASANTLGQDVMRSQRADVRFSKTVRLVNYHWKRKVTKIYQYDDMYMPRSTKVKVLGVNRYESIDKLFPREKAEGDNPNFGIGLTGKYDFSIANKSIDQQEKENQKRTVFYGSVLAHPIFGADEGNAYRSMEQQAEASEIYDFEMVVKKPKKANQLTPDEVIAKLMDGDEVLPDPDVNHADYISAVEVFMRSGNFKDAPPEIQQRFAIYLRIMQTMRQAAVLAFQDFNLTEGVKNQMAQPQNGGGQGPAGSAVPPPPPPQ